MVQQTISTNTFCEAKWLVSSDATQGTHTTIAGALTSASSGDTIFIRPGTYTENLTLKAGVNLTAYICDSDLNHVIISGKATFTAAGTVTISGIRLQTNSDFVLAVTGSAASIVNLKSCYLNLTNNTGISFTVTNTAAMVILENCTGNLGTTGIAIYSMSSTGELDIRYSILTNTGASTTASSNSAGLVQLESSYFLMPFSTTSTGQIGGFWSRSDTAATNTTTLTTAGNQNNGFECCTFSSGSASAISIGTGTMVVLQSSCTVGSTNTNAITGAGTLKYSFINFSNTSFLVNTTTQTYIPQGPKPAFSATLTSTQTNVTGDNTTVTAIYNNVLFDSQSNYSNGTGIFTAPITGKYRFSASLYWTGLTVALTTGNMAFVVNSTVFIFFAANPGTVRQGTGNDLVMCGSLQLNLTAGDTVKVTGNVNGATKLVSFASGVNANFCGELIN